MWREGVTYFLPAFASHLCQWRALFPGINQVQYQLKIIQSITLPNMSIPEAPFTIINSHHEPVPGQACWPLSLLTFFPLCGGGVSQYPVPKWLLFPYQCGEWFSMPVQVSFLDSCRFEYKLKHLYCHSVWSPEQWYHVSIKRSSTSYKQAKNELPKNCTHFQFGNICTGVPWLGAWVDRLANDLLLFGKEGRARLSEQHLPMHDAHRYVGVCVFCVNMCVCARACVCCRGCVCAWPWAKT